jgi:hypothetical protein
VRAYRVLQDVFAASSQSPQPSVHKHAIDAPSLNSFLIVYLYGTQTPGHAESLNSLSHVYTSTRPPRLCVFGISTTPLIATARRPVPRELPREYPQARAPRLSAYRARARTGNAASAAAAIVGGTHAGSSCKPFQLPQKSSKRARTWQATRLIRIGRRIGLNLLSGRRQARKKERTWPDPRSSMRLRMRRGCSGR